MALKPDVYANLKQHFYIWTNHTLLQKMFSASGGGGVAYDPADKGLCPWTQLGAVPQDPHYRLTLAMRLTQTYGYLLKLPFSSRECKIFFLTLYNKSNII